MKKEKFVYNKLMKNKYLFWLTGLSGSGKTSIVKLIHKSIERKYGPTIEISGDELRSIFLFKNYDNKSRRIYAKSYSKFCKMLLEKNFNVLFSTVSLFHDVQKWNKKKIYNKRKNLVGLNLSAEFPKTPNFLVENKFDNNIKNLSEKIKENIFKNCK